MIKYTYTIKSVDESTGTMAVDYASLLRETITVVLHLPVLGVDIEKYIQDNVPIKWWEEQVANRVIPLVGSSGSFGITKDGGHLAIDPEEVSAAPPELTIDQINSMLTK